MPIDTRDWYRERYGYRPPDSHRSYRPPRRKLPLGKIFLILLIVACVVATIYTGYLLLTHRTNWGVGAIVFAADIGVLIWNASALRKWGVGARTIISIFLVIAFLGTTACAFGGVEPFSSAKSEIASWFETGGTQTPPASTYPVELYSLATPIDPDTSMMLRTIQYWEGDSSRMIKFRATKSPWVVNSGYTPTSQISTKFHIMVYRDEDYKQPAIWADFGYEKTHDPLKGIYSVIMEETGDFIIDVDASGCEWWVKVGEE